jgi:hypothetical protein
MSRSQNFQCKCILRYKDTLQLLRTEWQQLFESLPNNSNYISELVICHEFPVNGSLIWLIPTHIHSWFPWNRSLTSRNQRKHSATAHMIFLEVFFWILMIMFFLLLRTLFPFFSMQVPLAKLCTQESAAAKFLKWIPILSFHANYSLSSLTAPSISSMAHVTVP